MNPTLELLPGLLLAIAGCAAAEPPRTAFSMPAAILEPATSGAWTFHRVGSDGMDSVAAVAALPDGGLVIAGHFEGAIDLGSDQLESAGETDAFVARLDRTGEVEWAARLGGAGFDAATAVVMDRAGNPVVVGDFTGSLRAGGRQLRARGQSDAFVASFRPDGTVRWGVALGGPEWDTAAAAALTSDGDIAVAGSTGTLERSDDRARVDDSDVLVARIAPDGALKWTRTFGGTEWDQGLAIAADRDGEVAVAGSFGGDLSLGVVSLVSAGLSDGFVLRVTSRGGISRAERIGGAGADAVTALAIAPDGTTALAGRFTGSVTVGDEVLVSAGESDAFIARAGADGRFDRAIRIGAAGADEVRALIALPGGGLLAAATTSLSRESQVMLYLVAESDAIFNLARLPGSFVSARGMAATRDGTAAIVGSFAHRVEAGSRAVAGAGGLDGFVMTTWLDLWGD